MKDPLKNYSESALIRNDLLLDQEMDFTTAPTKCTDYDKQLFEDYDKQVSLSRFEKEEEVYEK